MTKPRIINCGQAINEGLIEAGIKNDSVIYLAEGVDDPSAVYGTLSGLSNHFAASRIIEMPLSENALTGIAIGAALMGKRPVLSFHRVEFALLAMEQIVNNAAKTHYISRGNHSVPIVIRLIVGRGWGQGPAHSQSLEAMFAMIPGLKVIMPTFPADAKGLIIAAIEDNNPVIIIEHRWCHYIQGDVSTGYYTSDIETPKEIIKGEDITIVASSFMTVEAIEAAESLKELGYTASVFDLRVLRPLKLDTIINSVNKTGRLITIDLGFKKFGIGAEIVSEVTANCFSSLKAAPVRLGMPEHPSPSSRGYLEGLYPDSILILKEAAKILNIDSNKLNDTLFKIKERKKHIPIDVPDPKFKGPF
jgi:pyruvate/2-oxoglutarate/acetoin dehydrogenase E1 component